MYENIPSTLNLELTNEHPILRSKDFICLRIKAIDGIQETEVIDGKIKRSIISNQINFFYNRISKFYSINKLIEEVVVHQ